MPGKVFIRLDDNDTYKKISINESGFPNPEHIREVFSKTKKPVYLYGPNNEEYQIGVDALTANEEYIWKTREEEWEQTYFVQTALFCAEAVYETNPNQYLKNVENVKYHDVKKVIGLFKIDSDNEQRVLIALAENTETKSKMLVVAFRGTQTHEDWKTNFELNMVAVNDFCGMFHEGFHKVANTISAKELIDLAMKNDVHGILTCGHSLGGAISSIVHMNLRNAYPNDLEEFELKRKNIVNITFGAPFFGNKRLQDDADSKGHSWRMFHFASVLDIVPSVLSLGHLIKTMKEKAIRVASDATAGFSEVFRQWISSDNLDKGLAFCYDVIKANCENESIENLIDCLKDCLPPSTLQNEFQNENFVPIGRHVILAETRPAEMLNISSKLTERILQSAIEFATSELWVNKIVDYHSLKMYKHIIKDNHFKGFKAREEPTQLLLNKTDKILCNEKSLKGLQMKNLCTHHCAFGDNCSFITSYRLYEQFDAREDNATVWCRTCFQDDTMQNYFFHAECSKTFHEALREHIITPLKNMDKVDEQALQQVFDSSYNEEEMYKYVETSVMERFVNSAIFSTLPAISYDLFLYSADEVVTAAASNVVATTGLGIELAIGGNFLASAAIFVWKSREQQKKFQREEITQEQFHRSVAVIGGEALGACIAGSIVASYSVACAASGPVGWILLAIGALASVAGGYVGGLAAEKLVDKVKGDKWGKERVKIDKTDEIALIYVEAMIVLNTPRQTTLNDLTANDIRKAFKKQAFQYHPDKLSRMATQHEQQVAKRMWILLLMARDTLLEIKDGDHFLPDIIMKKIDEKVADAWRDKRKVDADRLLGKIQKYCQYRHEYLE